jgi:hypothetical protein
VKDVKEVQDVEERSAILMSVLCGSRFHKLRISQIKAAFSSTGTLACAGFDALTINAQPRVAVLLDFIRSLFNRDICEDVFWGH